MEKIKLFKNCIVCKKKIKKQWKRYKRFCSNYCYVRYWRKNNPEKYKLLNSTENLKKYRWQNKINKECLICGFKRAIDFCHIISRKNNGKLNKNNIVLLCPNHHRLFDRNRLTKDENIIIKRWLNSLT